MSIPVLRIFDSQGNDIEIPAIKGEKGDAGDLTSSVLLRAGSDLDDYTLRYSDGLQVSFGSFSASQQSAQQIASLNASSALYSIALKLPIPVKKVFAGEFSAAPDIFLQYHDLSGLDNCLSIDGTATVDIIQNMRGIFLRPAEPGMLNGCIRYYAIGRWK